MDIKCGYGNLKPDAIVVVATIRALRHHGGAKKEEYNTPSMERVTNGFANLEKHIENCQKFGLFPVVAINHFPTDTDEEIQFVIDACAKMGVKAVVSKGFAHGGEGTKELATAVVAEVESGRNAFKPLYDWSIPVKDKIEKIAKEIYGADAVQYTKEAEGNLRTIERLGLAGLPVCMAKTQKSFSDDESKIGRPRNFIITVREFEYAVGAGFIIPILGEMMRMPGLPPIPASEHMDIDANGVVSGLS
jgi:formate--tetrahydrofolate ligase